MMLKKTFLLLINFFMTVQLSEAIEYLKIKIQIIENALLKCLNPNAFYILEKSKNVFTDFYDSTIAGQIADLRSILSEIELL